MDNDKTR